MIPNAMSDILAHLLKEQRARAKKMQPTMEPTGNRGRKRPRSGSVSAREGSKLPLRRISPPWPVKRASSQAARWERRCNRLLAQLARKLRRLDREQRRVVLEQRFSQEQRLALERWMLTHCDEQAPVTSRSACANKRQGSKSCARRPPFFEEQWAVSRRKPGCSGTKKTLLSARKIVPHQRTQKEVPCPGDKEDRGVISATSPRTSATSFFALAYLGMLRLTSRRSLDREVALRHREVLCAVIQRATALAGVPELNLPRAIKEVLPQHHVTPAELGLRLAVRIWAQRWVSQALSTPVISVVKEADLHQGLSAWSRLNSARQALQVAERNARGGRGAPPSMEETSAWRALKEVFLDVEEKAGKSRSEREAVLAKAEAERATYRERLAETWNRQRMLQEDRAAARQKGAEAATARKQARRASKEAEHIAQLLKHLAVAEGHLRHAP